MLLRSVLAASVAAITFAAPASANLLTNGGFEAGNFSGWSLTGDTSFTGITGNAPEGAFQAYFGSVENFGYLTQSVATNAGATYTLTFKLANGGGTPSAFSVSLDGQTLDSQNNAGAFGSTDYSYSMVASGTSTTLQFAFYQSPDYYYLDAVSLDETSPAPVPEPAMLGLFGLGALGLGLSRRRKAA